MKLQRFVVRVTGTDLFFPDLGKQKRGFSHTDPEPGGGAFGPRLFRTHKSAFNAIVAWKQGQHEHGYYDNGFGDAGDFVKLKAIPTRKLIALEIVPATITIGDTP